MPRPRKLDTNEALDAVLGVFWRKGYEGTSYTDLVAATGVERPALYAAFGNKQALFLHALERYGSDYGNYVEDALKQTTAREVATHFLHGAVELSTRFSDRRGCLGINGALAVSDHAEVPRRALIEWRAEGEMLLRERFERGCGLMARYGVGPPPLQVRRMERRWGSCTPSGRVLLNPRLVLAPTACIDYVVVHELCHLQHPHHGRDFYDLLGRVMPDWEDRKARLDLVQ